MGLDMYLVKRKKNSDDYTDIMYWRKANQIREWFAENLECGVENCQYSEVKIVNLIDLSNICKEVIKDHNKAQKLLPTSQGFFFGSYEYDEWYFDTLGETVKKLEKIITETDWANEKVFYYEWW